MDGDFEGGKSRGTSPIKGEKKKRSNLEDQLEVDIDEQSLSARVVARAREGRKSPLNGRCEEED
jgi:hypothetical protein